MRPRSVGTRVGPRGAAGKTVREALPRGPGAAPGGSTLQSLDRQLCFALYSASLAMTRLYTPLLRSLGLTYPQYLVMLTLWQAAPIGVNGLGQRLFLDSGTLTPLLKRLELAGLVVRTRDAADERRVSVSLTVAGQALQRRAEALPTAVLAAADCQPVELGALMRQLQALRERLLAASASTGDPGDPTFPFPTPTTTSTKGPR